MNRGLTFLIVGVVVGALIAYFWLAPGKGDDIEPVDRLEPEEDLIPFAGSAGLYQPTRRVVNMKCDPESGLLLVLPDPAFLAAATTPGPQEVLWVVPKEIPFRWEIEWKGLDGETDQFPPPEPKVIPCSPNSNAFNSGFAIDPVDGADWTYSVRAYDCETSELVCERDPRIRWRG